MRLLLLVASVLVLLTACGSADSDTAPTASTEPAPDAPSPTSEPPEQPSPTPTLPANATDELFPDVLAAEARQSDDGSWAFDVTLSSPYDTRERYADAWRILDQNGNELGVRVLVHDHATEQPFTRSLSGVEIPADVQTVTVEGRDIESGWGGATVEVTLE